MRIVNGNVRFEDLVSKHGVGEVCTGKAYFF